jgi:hypothetical protein
MKNKKIYILAICLAVVLTGCSFNLGKKQNVLEVKKEPVVNDAATSSEKIATSTTENVVENQEDTNLDSSNWKTYSDSVHGFELKIPQEGVNVQALTFAEAEAIDARQEKNYLEEGGMAYAPVFSYMHDGRVGKDFKIWTKGDKNYDYYEKDFFYAKCKKDVNQFYSCFYLSQEGGAVFYEKIIYHRNARISIKINFPNNRFLSLNWDEQKGMTGLLSLYMKDDFTEKEKKYFEAMDKIIASIKFTK